MPFSTHDGVFAVTTARDERLVLPYLYRQVINYGYVAAGYANGVAWRNVNQITHSNDTFTNLGDLLQAAANYTSGASGRNNAFVWGTNGTGTQGVGAFTTTSNFNMRNNTTYTATTSMNTAQTVGDSSTIQKQDLWGTYQLSYQNGNQGAAVWQKFNLVTEVAASTGSSNFQQGGTGAGAHFSENWGYFWADAADTATTDRVKFTFATEQESVPATSPGNHGQQKGTNAKTGYGYGGNEGTYNGGNNFRKWSYATEVSVGTYGKPITNAGEENYDMGQTHNYLGGMYNGAQNNLSWRWNYATDSGTTSGIGSPSGTATGTGSTAGAIPGRSSGTGHWRD